MRKIILSTLALAALFLIGCQEKNVSYPNHPTGQQYYTQFTLFEEDGEYLTTNYRIGRVIPINTPVTLVASGSEEAELLLDDGTTLEVINIADYSGEDMQGILDRMLGQQPVSLSHLSESQRSAVMVGNPEIGMSKDTVLLAMGYPPKHRTPSLDVNQWRYWMNRFDTKLLHFQGDRLDRIED